MTRIHPPVLVADLWNDDGRLGKTLDALFSREDDGITGLLIGYHYTDGHVIATGPAQIAERKGGLTRLFEDLPSDDSLAASIGRAIQAAFSAGHINDFLAEIQETYPVCEEGETLQVLYTANGMILFQDDPWGVIENHPIATDLDTATAQICTIVLRPAESAHAKISRGTAFLDDLETFDVLQRNGLDVLRMRQGVFFTPPSVSTLVSHL